MNFAPLTDALVDLRRTLRAACRRGMISSEQRAKLEGAARAVNFRERTLVRMVTGCGDGEDGIEKLCRALSAAFVQQKRRDALQALELLRDEVFTAPAPPDFKLTAAFAKDLGDAGLSI